MVGFLAIAKNEKGKVHLFSYARLLMMTDKIRCRHRSAYWFWCSWRSGCQSWSKCWCEAAYYKQFGLDKKQVKDIADKIPNGTALGFVLIEHLWPRFKEIAFSKNAVLLANGFITRDALIDMGAQLAEGAKAADKVELK